MLYVHSFLINVNHWQLCNMHISSNIKKIADSFECQQNSNHNTINNSNNQTISMWNDERKGNEKMKLFQTANAWIGNWALDDGYDYMGLMILLVLVKLCMSQWGNVWLLIPPVFGHYSIPFCVESNFALILWSEKHIFFLPSAPESFGQFVCFDDKRKFIIIIQ